MKKLISLFFMCFFIGDACAESYPAASVGYVCDVLNKTGLCRLQNSAPDNVAANMEYLMRAVDICNRGITQYGKSEYASHQMANTAAVNYMTDLLYVSDGLLVTLDVNNMEDWITDGEGTLEILDNGIKLTHQDLRTRDLVDLSPYENVTVELRFKLENPDDIFMVEHSSDWNTQKCGFGFAVNLRTSTYQANEVHANVHSGYVNYTVNTTDLLSHTLVKTVTTIDNAHHLTFYDGVKQEEPVWANGGNLYCYPLRDDFFHVGYRPWRDTGDNKGNAILHSLRIYNRALTAAEVCHNAWVDWRRFGGKRPDCEE